jgi:hypothetical protein
MRKTHGFLLPPEVDVCLDTSFVIVLYTVKYVVQSDTCQRIQEPAVSLSCGVCAGVRVARADEWQVVESSETEGT